MKQRLEFMLKDEPVMRFNRTIHSSLKVSFESVENYVKNSGFEPYKPSIVELSETEGFVGAMIYQKAEKNPSVYVAIVSSNGIQESKFEFLVYHAQRKESRVDINKMG
jgi:hypothetical protein